MDDFHWIAHGIFLTDLLIRIGLTVRVIMRRLPVGVTLAWMMLILMFPIIGAVIYLSVGEYRLGFRRARRAAEYRKNRDARRSTEATTNRFNRVDLGPESAALARLGEAGLGAAVLPGNRLKLQENADAAFPALIADIDSASRTCHLEFYIWSLGGRADEVGAALIRAVQRGVKCRVLVDALGSKSFVKSQLARELRQAGVVIAVALPAGLLHLLFSRPDLRLHRKIVIIDGVIGYTGSLNLADPLFFKKDAGVGQWVDAFVRLQGPAVDALADTFDEDWALETGETLGLVRPLGDASPETTEGRAPVQVLPTGPDAHIAVIEQIVLMTIYAATREVVLTTPYFVPSESLLLALLSAAARGVQVTLIVPAKVDSRLVALASRSVQADLLAAGVGVAQFKGGLLHTKSITVDGQFSLFGSLNLDPRSLRLNFEISLAVYDAEFTATLRQLQQHYLEASTLLTLDNCRARSALERFAEDTARLAGPLL